MARWTSRRNTDKRQSQGPRLVPREFVFIDQFVSVMHARAARRNPRTLLPSTDLHVYEQCYYGLEEMGSVLSEAIDQELNQHQRMAIEAASLLMKKVQGKCQGTCLLRRQSTLRRSRRRDEIVRFWQPEIRLRQTYYRILSVISVVSHQSA